MTSNVRHLFKTDGMPALTHTQRTLLKELSRFEKAIDTALQETRAAVHGDDAALAVCAARRLQALGAHFGMLAREAETT